MDKVETSSVYWIDVPNEIDLSFLDPLIPTKAAVAIADPLLASAVDRLFESNFPSPWALFRPFPGYKDSIKRLFQKKVLETFDLEFAKERLDNFFESGQERAFEGEKIYTMLEELAYLNSILEEIYLKILSCLKP